MKRKLRFMIPAFILILGFFYTISPGNNALAASSTSPVKNTSVVSAKTLEYIAADYSASGLDSLFVSPLVGGDSTSLLDLQTQYTPRYSIQNSSGTVVKTGSLNHWQRSEEYYYSTFMYRSRTNINTASLPAGHYRVNILLNVHGTSYTTANYPELTQHFYINSNRTLNQFSQ